jgi:hypothetical protein
MRFGRQTDSFMSHFHEFLERLAEVPDEPRLVVLKKLGFVAVIDGLSKVGASEESRNRPRFVSFIRNFSSWSDGERISLPHLVEALSRDTQAEFQPLREHANELFSQSWRPRSAIPPGPHPITRDPMPDQVLGPWPKGKRILNKLSEESFRHVNLLYSYRNSLAHELRERGFPLLESNVPHPYYRYTTMHTPENVEGRKTWLLHYPLGFFSTLTVTCLEALGGRLRAEDINPYDYYKVGSEFMLEELE